MAIDLTALPNYVKDNEKVLITGALTGSKTGEIIIREGNLHTGIKTSERIGILDVDVVFQNGDGCGFNPATGGKITQREIVVGNVKIEDSICVPELEKKYTQLMMQAGSHNDTVPQPIEKVYTNRKIRKIKGAIERADWQGDTASADANLNKYDGFNKIIDTSSTLVPVNAKKGFGTITTSTGTATVTGTGTSFSSQVAVGDKLYRTGTLIGTVSAIGSNTSITFTGNSSLSLSGVTYTIVPAAVATVYAGATAANIEAILDTIITALPQELFGDEQSDTPDGEEGATQATIWMGWDMAKLLLMAIKARNNFHYGAEKGMLKDGFDYPGFAIRIMPTPGLTGTGRIHAIAPENMHLGLDLEHEEENIDTWYEKKDDAVLSRIRFKRGVQIGFPNEVVSFLVA